MVADGLLLEEAESFDRLMEKCKAIQEQVNVPFIGDDKS
jgi:hypothetical protein